MTKNLKKNKMTNFPTKIKECGAFLTGRFFYQALWVALFIPFMVLATVHIYGLRRLTTVPWFQIKGWRKQHFSACCEIGIAFPEKVRQSSFLGFKGFLEINRVSNLNISQGTLTKKFTNARKSYFPRELQTLQC